MAVMTSLADDVQTLLMVGDCVIVVDADIVVPVIITGATVDVNVVAAKEVPSFGCSFVTGNIKGFMTMLATSGDIMTQDTTDGKNFSK